MKFLLIRLSSLGDVVLATSAVEALAAARPEAEIHILTKPAFREVFAQNPHVRLVIEWEEQHSPREVSRRLSGEHYDHVVDLHANLRTRLLRFFLGGNWSVYRKGSLRRRLALWLSRPGWLAKDHVVDRYIAALEPLGVPATRVLPRLYPSQDDHAQALEFLREAEWDGAATLVALAPGARWATKMWPREKWVLLTELCWEAGYFLVIVGGAEDAGIAHDIAAVAPGASCNAAGRTRLLGTAALLSLCRVLVTNDSAPLHVAVASGTPVVALFGPTARGFGFFPLGPKDRVLEVELPCRPCRLHGGDRCPEEHFRCLDTISADEAFQALEEIVK